MSTFTGKQETAPSFGRYGKVGGSGERTDASREVERNGQENGGAYLRRTPERISGWTPGRRGRERRAKAGAPPLACNVWLEAEIARLGEEAGPSYRHLYKEWLGRYYTLRGYYPADPKRSFRAAVASCINRLRR